MGHLAEPRVFWPFRGQSWGSGRNSICRPGVPLGTRGMGPRAVGPGPHCVLRDAAHVGTHGDSSPPGRVPPGEPLASGPNPPNFVLVTHSVQFGMASPPCLMPFQTGLAPPRRFTYFCVPNLLVSASCVGAQCRTCGSWTRLGAQGRGVWAGSCRAVALPVNRTLRFHGRFGVDPLPRCTCRVSGKALTGPGATPFTEWCAPFGTPRPGGHARGTGLPAGGGHVKRPQDATAGILALLNRVWYPARRAIAQR